MSDERTKPNDAVSLEATQISSDTSHGLTLTRYQRIREHDTTRELFAHGNWQPFTPLPTHLPTNLVPGCTLQAVIGTGGMGTVYLARQNALNRQVAVKVLNPKLANDPVFMSRLKQEAQIMATMTHPNLVGCHDIIISKNGAFLLMEYIPGHLNGRNLVKLLGPMPERYVTQVVLEATRGLAYAYEKGYMHRDVKPDNLLFAFQENRAPESYQEVFESPDFRVALCDFGIASTRESLEELLDDDGDETNPEDSRPIVGSPLYMAPEQALAPETVDCRSDMYSLASTAFFLLTGKPPFPGKSLEEVMEMKALYDLPTPTPDTPLPPVDPEFSRTLRRMGAAQQEKRYQSYQQLLPRLEAIAAPYTSNLSFRIFTRRYRKFLKTIGMAATLVALIILGGLYAYTSWLNTYEKRLTESTVQLARWSGDLASWSQSINDGGPMLIANRRSGPITLREPITVGDMLRISLYLQDIGSATLLVHEEGIPENVYVRVICTREDVGNVIRVSTPHRGTGGQQFVDIPAPLEFPDSTEEWIQLRFQLYKDYCIVWNRYRPLVICNYPRALSGVNAQFTIKNVNCPMALFKNIAHIEAKYVARLQDDDLE